MPPADTPLTSAERCLLVYRESDGPAVASLDCWSDGGGIWLATSRSAAEVTALRRDRRCAVWIDPPTQSEAGVAIDGTARIYDLSDPVGLLLHAPTISAALAALALTHRSAIARYVRRLPRMPAAWMPHDLILMRVRIDRARSLIPPPRVTGVGPVLPTELPAGVRRALTGERHVTLAMSRQDALVVQPAVWGSGFRLDVGAGVANEGDTPACILVEQHIGTRSAGSIVLLLRGRLDSGFDFRPTHATWWEGFSSGSAALGNPATASGIVLPD